MKKYRIKKEAVPYFLEKYATSIYTLEKWEKLGIFIMALEEIEPVYISFGRRINEKTTKLGGWNKEDGSFFEFTINFPSVKYHEHDKFSKGKITRDLMNIIQSDLSDFYERFINEKNK